LSFVATTATRLHPPAQGCRRGYLGTVLVVIVPTLKALWPIAYNRMKQTSISIPTQPRCGWRT